MAKKNLTNVAVYDDARGAPAVYALQCERIAFCLRGKYRAVQFQPFYYPQGDGGRGDVFAGFQVLFCVGDRAAAWTLSERTLAHPPPVIARTIEGFAEDFFGQ